MCSMKCTFIFFNSLFLASGVALIVIGVMARTTYSEIGGSAPSQTAILLIVVGVVITVISLLGFFGVFLDNSILLAVFICILVLIIALEIITGIALYVRYPAVKLFLLKHLWVVAVCVALGVMEGLGVLLGLCLCVDIKRRSYQNL